MGMGAAEVKAFPPYLSNEPQVNIATRKQALCLLVIAGGPGRELEVLNVGASTVAVRGASALLGVRQASFVASILRHRHTWRICSWHLNPPPSERFGVRCGGLTLPLVSNCRYNERETMGRCSYLDAPEKMQSLPLALPQV